MTKDFLRAHGDGLRATDIPERQLEGSRYRRD